VAGDYRFKAPRIGFIPDRNPTAFTYGLLRSNARIVVTQGIFEFLSEEEQRAVVAHELGHIVNRDFILMTMAGMLVQILYQIYAALARSQRSSSSKEGNKLAVIGFVALIFYYIGIYLLLYLSRTREYLADAFSAGRVEPRHLAGALIKIAYGIVAIKDTEATQPASQHAPSRRDRRQERPLYRPSRREHGGEPRCCRRGHAVRQLQSLGRAHSAQLHASFDGTARRPSRRDRQREGTRLRRLRCRGRGGARAS
jgi:Zn-dependent protease with chaperone function